MPERSDRVEYDKLYHRDDTNRKHHPEPDAPPDEVEIVSPTMIMISGPSFDIQAESFRDPVTEAYVDFMLRGGKKSFTSRLSTDRGGFLTFDYSYRKAKAKRPTEDFWEYHGPMEVEIESSFVDKPLEENLEGIENPLRQCFLAGGFEGAAAEMHAYEDVLSKLRYSVSHKLLNFKASPLVIPFSSGKVASLKEEDFQQKVLKSSPKVYIHWRG